MFINKSSTAEACPKPNGMVLGVQTTPESTVKRLFQWEIVSWYIIRDVGAGDVGFCKFETNSKRKFLTHPCITMCRGTRTTIPPSARRLHGEICFHCFFCTQISVNCKKSIKRFEFINRGLHTHC